MDNQNSAYYYYDRMVFNYAKYLKGGVDKKSSYGRFINAAIALAQLQAANPFEHDNDPAPVRPTPDTHTFTAVVEK